MNQGKIVGIQYAALPLSHPGGAGADPADHLARHPALGDPQGLADALA